MESSTPSADYLPPSRELNEPGAVRTILAVLGLLLAAVGGYLLFAAETSLNAEIEAAIEMPLAEFRQMPEEVWSTVESARQSDLKRRHIAYGSILGAGILIVLLSLFARRRLLVTTISALVLLVLTAVAFGVISRKRPIEGEMESETAVPPMKVEKIIVWVSLGVAAAGLLWATKIALGHRRSLAARSLAK